MAGEDKRSPEKGDAVTDDEKRERFVQKLIETCRKVAEEVGTPEAMERYEKYKRTGATLVEKH